MHCGARGERMAVMATVVGSCLTCVLPYFRGVEATGDSSSSSSSACYHARETR